MGLDSWAGSVDLSAPAGKLLLKLVSALPTDRHFAITVFGSASLQINIDPGLNSVAVDLFCNDEDLKRYVKRTLLAQGDFYIHVWSALNFQANTHWAGRAKWFTMGHCTIRFPHPIDILIAKMNRMDDKDFEAFRVVIRKTGHPTEAELIHELQMAVDLFRPSFDEEQGHDMANNCRRLWPVIFGREIDPRTEIIAPALKKRREGYGEPTRDYKQELRDAVASYGKP